MRSIVVPPAPGVTSALGLLMADPRRDYVTSRLRLVSQLDPGELTTLLTELRGRAEREFTDEGYRLDQLRLEFAVDVRYLGQGYELTVPIGSDDTADVTLIADLRRRFDDQHDRMFGHSAPEEEAEAVNFRVRASAVVRKATLGKHARTSTSADSARISESEVCFDAAAGPIATPVYDRSLLAPGHTIQGPAIIEQLDSTTVVYPAQQAVVDDYLNIVISLG